MTRDEEQDLEGDETFAEVCEARRDAWVEALESESAEAAGEAVEAFIRAG